MKHTGNVNDGYVTGLEPATNFPNPRSFEAERDRVVPLAAGQCRQFDLCLDYHHNAESVAKAEQSIEILSNSETPIVHDRPLPEWSFNDA